MGGVHYHRLAFRRGKKRAAIALAHTLLIIVITFWFMKKTLRNSAAPTLTNSIERRRKSVWRVNSKSSGLRLLSLLLFLTCRSFQPLALLQRNLSPKQILTSALLFYSFSLRSEHASHLFSWEDQKWARSMFHPKKRRTFHAIYYLTMLPTGLLFMTSISDRLRDPFNGL